MVTEACPGLPASARACGRPRRQNHLRRPTRGRRRCVIGGRAGQDGTVDAAPTEPPTGRAPAVLVAAVGLGALETAAEIVGTLGRTAVPLTGRVALAAVLGLKGVMLWRTLGRHAGAALGVFVWEAAAIWVALAATDWPGLLRLALGLTALAVIGLLTAALRSFPQPDLPRLGSA